MALGNQDGMCMRGREGETPPPPSRTSGGLCATRPNFPVALAPKTHFALGSMTGIRP